MRRELYNECLAKAKKDYKELISKTEKDLDMSTSKGEDWYILNSFWGEFMPPAIGGYPSELFFDDEAMMPMPESVHKQFVNMLFANHIKNIDVLYDVSVWDGFEDYERYQGHPQCEYEPDGDPVRSVTKKEAVDWYNENMFAN